MRQLRLGYPSNWADVWRTVQPHLNIAPSYPTGWRMISAMRAIIMNNTEKIAILRIITSFDSLLASAGGPAGTGAASTGAATGAGLALGDSELVSRLFLLCEWKDFTVAQLADFTGPFLGFNCKLFPHVCRPVEGADSAIAWRREEGAEGLHDRADAPGRLPELGMIIGHRETYFLANLESAARVQQHDGGRRERVVDGQQETPVVKTALEIRTWRSANRKVILQDVVSDHLDLPMRGRPGLDLRQLARYATNRRHARNLF